MHSRPIPSNPQPGIKKLLGLLCTHISLYTFFLDNCIVIVCLHVPRACWAVSAQMLYEGRDVYTNVYNYRFCLEGGPDFHYGPIFVLSVEDEGP